MNAKLLILDLVLTAILRFVAENRSEIDGMTDEEFQALADKLQSRRKEWMAKYTQ
jgi:hypothetical protein